MLLRDSNNFPQVDSRKQTTRVNARKNLEERQSQTVTVHFLESPATNESNPTAMRKYCQVKSWCFSGLVDAELLLFLSKFSVFVIVTRSNLPS